MTCYHPIKAFRTPDGVVFHARHGENVLGDVELPCGQCIGCRTKRAQAWAVRITHESQMHEWNCFVTLTYDEANLPGPSLKYSDFQEFMRRLRRWSPSRVRFFVAGEYGPLNLRPHFHACLFGVDFRDRVPAGRSESGEKWFSSEKLTELWGKGRASVQDLTFQSAAYCARYVVDKVTGDAAEDHYRSVDADGVLTSRVPEFCRCSLKPGIGLEWLRRFRSDVFPGDFAVLDGTKVAPPKYYWRKLQEWAQQERSTVTDEIEFVRQQRAKAAFADNTPERLAVRKQVHKARVRNQRRSDQ